MAAMDTEGATTVRSQAPEMRERRPERERWMYGSEMSVEEREVSMGFVNNGSQIAALGGLGAFVLTILSFCGIVPVYLTAIAVIAAGAGLFFEAGAVAARYGRLPAEVAPGFWSSFALTFGALALLVAGADGITLGVLALIGFYAVPLTAIAVLVFGGGLMLGTGMSARLHRVEWGERHPWLGWINRTAPVTQFLLGAAVTVLGILAVAGYAPLSLSIVGMLLVGIALFLSGTAISGRIMHSLHRW